MPRKVFTAGEVLAAADVNNFLMDQSVMTFADSAARGSAIGTATEGMVTYLEDTDGLELWNGAAWVSATPASGGGSGNAIINGAFDIWQRGTTFTNQATNAYSADRWRVSSLNSTIDVSRSTFTLGASPESGLDGKYFATITAEATDSDARFNQAIEGATSFAGQTVTVSFYAKSNVTTDALRWIRLQQNFGSGGSPSASTNTDSSPITLTSSWARYSVTLSVPSVSGKTLGTNGNDFLGLAFGLKASTAQTLDIWGVQVEAGSTATPFRRNANSLEGELAACQRYYTRFNALGNYSFFGAGSNVNTTASIVGIHFPTTMRVNPTSMDFSATLGVYDYGISDIAVTALSLIGTHVSNNFGMVEATVASGLTDKRNSWLGARNAANQFIGFSAEL